MIYFGMPQWHLSHWQDWLYSRHIPANQRLAEYAKVFNAVEVGSTFYTDVSTDSLARWFDSVPEAFRFSFKTPQTITHQLSVISIAEAEDLLQAFCLKLMPYHERIGPTMMQFPSSVSGYSFDKVCALLGAWCIDAPLSVELRHLDWFDKNHYELELLRCLSEKQLGRVLMDSRPIFSTDAYCDSLVDAQRKKPRVPCHVHATNRLPVVRFIGHPDLSLNQVYLDQWTTKLVQWLQEGREPYVFVHSSDNHVAPLLAHQLEQKVQDKLADYRSVIQLPDRQSQAPLF